MHRSTSRIGGQRWPAGHFAGPRVGPLSCRFCVTAVLSFPHCRRQYDCKLYCGHASCRLCHDDIISMVCYRAVCFVSFSHLSVGLFSAASRCSQALSLNQSRAVWPLSNSKQQPDLAGYWGTECLRCVSIKYRMNSSSCCTTRAQGASLLMLVRTWTAARAS